MIAATVAPERTKIIANYGSPELEFTNIAFDLDTGLMDLDDLKSKISDEVAAIYFENPSYLGFIESQGNEISAIAKEHDVLLVVGVILSH